MSEYLNAQYRVLQKLKSISQAKKQTVQQFDINTLATDLYLTKLHFIVAINSLKKSGFIDSIIDENVIYFKVTNIGMECV